MERQHADDDRDDLLRRDRLRGGHRDRQRLRQHHGQRPDPAAPLQLLDDHLEHVAGRRLLVHVVCRWREHGVRRPTHDARLLPGAIAWGSEPPLYPASAPPRASSPSGTFGLRSRRRRATPVSLRPRFAHVLSPVRAPGRLRLRLRFVVGCRLRSRGVRRPGPGPPRRRRPRRATPGLRRRPAPRPRGRQRRERTGTRRRPTARPASTRPSCRARAAQQHDFHGGKYIPWTTSFTAPGTGNGFVKDGQFCINVINKGDDPWDAQTRHREMIIQKGHVYSIAFMAHATKPVQMKAKVGMSGPPYKEYWADTVDLTTHPQTSSACSRWRSPTTRRPSSRSTSAARWRARRRRRTRSASTTSTSTIPSS